MDQWTSGGPELDRFSARRSWWGTRNGAAKMASLARRATASSPSRHGHRQPSTAAFGVDFLETAEIGLFILFGLTFIYFIYFRGFSRIAMQRPLCRIMTLQWEHWSFWMTIRCLAYSGLEVLIPLISVFLCVQAETVNKGRSLVATADPLWSLLLKTSESTALRVS